VDFILNGYNPYILLIALLSGTLLLWPNLSRRGAQAVGVSAAVQMVNRNQAVLLDIRTPEQYQTGTIAQARNLPAAEVSAKLATLPKNKPLIVFCAQGHASAKVVAQLRKEGLDAVSLEGGLKAWNQAGMPLGKPVLPGKSRTAEKPTKKQPA